MTTTINRTSTLPREDRLYSTLRAQARNRMLVGLNKTLIVSLLLGVLLNMGLLLDSTNRQQHAYTALGLIAATVALLYIARRLESQAGRLRLRLALVARHITTTGR